MTAILKITDGTEATEIDLLSLPGFQLESWRPQIAGYKGDGTFQSSPLAPGRQLVNKQFDNIIETFQFKAQDVSQDALIEDVQNLVRMLEKATSYWSTDWQDTTVYIEAKATEETNTRYGHIMSYRIPELENPYSQPFLQRKCEAVMDNLTLIIEHTPWTENVPRGSTSVETSSVETYDGRNLGNVDSTGTREPTTDKENYIATKRNVANLTDIYRDNGGVFSANLMDAALPQNLLPNPVTVADATYFGIDTTITDSGPFCSLVFDVGTAGTGYTTIWEYWNGAWVALTVKDNTDNGTHAFENTGVNSIHWEQPGGWVTTTVNGVTGYWVRVRVVTTPGVLVTPTQQNRNIYTITWPYIEIQSTAVLGDIVSRAKFNIQNQSDSNSPTGTLTPSDRVLCGLRSVSRGENFTAYLNASDEQNPSGITVAVGTATSFVTDVTTPTGRKARYNSAAAHTEDAVTWTLDNTIGQDFYGQFHAFVRYTRIAGAGDEVELTLQVSAGSGGRIGGSVFSSETIRTFETSGAYKFFDFGKIQIPPSSTLNLNDIPDELEIIILLEHVAPAVTATIDFFDLILLPVDEWAGDFQDLADASITISNTGSLTDDKFLDADGISRPKVKTQSLARIASTDQVYAIWLSIVNSSPLLQANVRQRIWFVTSNDGAYSSAVRGSSPYAAHTVLSFKNQQYISMRGDR